MKKLFAVLTMCMALAGAANAAFADETYFNAYSTDYGSTTQKTTFAYNEQPWIFLQLTDGALTESLGTISTDSKWISPSGATFSVNQINTTNGFWISSTDAAWFGSGSTTGYREVGDWTVTLYFSTVNTGDGDLTYTSKDINFHVNAVPEPISAGLFLLGGASLAVIRRRKA